MSSNRLKLLLVSVMAVVAISAVASASASAAVTCYPVAEKETGRFASSATCEARTPVIAKGAWINAKLEKEIEPGVACAKVETAKTGRFATLKTCEEGKPTVTEGEFIRVKVSRDQWDVCEEGTGTGTKYTEHKCTTVSGTGKWEWKVLTAATETRKVISSGGEFKLKAGTLTVTCKKVADKGTITGGKPGTDLAEEIKFTECTTGEAGCEVKSAGGVLGTIVVTNIPTKLEQVTVGEEEIEVDLFESKTIENKEKEKEKEFVTLEFSGASCAKPGYVTTKVKGNVAAETVPGTGELNFPSPAITAADTLNAFGVSATLTGKDTQELENGWAVTAI